MCQLSGHVITSEDLVDVVSCESGATLPRDLDAPVACARQHNEWHQLQIVRHLDHANKSPCWSDRSEEHTSELQSLMRISYAVLCLKKKTRSHITSITKTTRTTI